MDVDKLCCHNAFDDKHSKGDHRTRSRSRGGVRVFTQTPWEVAIRVTKTKASAAERVSYLYFVTLEVRLGSQRAILENLLAERRSVLLI